MHSSDASLKRLHGIRQCDVWLVLLDVTWKKDLFIYIFLDQVKQEQQPLLPTAYSSLAG